MALHFESLDRARDLARLGEIAGVLGAHGLGELTRRLGLSLVLRRAGMVLRRSETDRAEKEPQVRLREAFERLGPTFVKLGQLLAGRSDLLPRTWTEELARLREEVAPVPWEELRLQLEQDLGQDPARLFARLDREPLAAGSIAQVHRAELADGTRVVLKIRRPRIEEVVSADLRLLARVAEWAEERGALRAYGPRQVVRHFARVLRGELDLRREARNAERLEAGLPPGGRLVIPRIHGRFTRERLCVMDELEGPSLGEWIRSGKPGACDPGAIARDGTEAILRMVFVQGVFHADPHAGNVMLLPDGRLGLLDFGQVGYLSEARRAEFLELLLAVVERRPPDAAQVVLGWATGEPDPELFEQDCAEFIDRYRFLPLRELRAGELVQDIHALVRENGLVLPPDVALLLKVFLTLEDLGRALDPSFVASEHVQPFLGRGPGERASGGRFSPLQLVRQSAGELRRLLAALPRDLRALRSSLQRGRLKVELNLRSLERFSGELDRSVNHLTIGIITAALIVGTSVAMTVTGGPRLLGLPAFGLVGFLSSLAVGLWWIVVSHRRGR
jgi:ubiquinone biosynthesis protein